MRTVVDKPFGRALVSAVLAALVTILPTGALVAAPCWPPPVTAHVADPFRKPACRWCPGNRGIEYATSAGVAIHAVAAGTVTFAGTVAGVGYVVVRDARGWRVTYGGLGEIVVAGGDRVVARSVVGVTAGAFHLGLRVGEQYIDPQPYVGHYAHRARLVPVDGSAGAPPGAPVLRCASTNVPSTPTQTRTRATAFRRGAGANAVRGR